MHTLHEFFYHTEAISYLLGGGILIAFIAFWLFLTGREEN